MVARCPPDPRIVPPPEDRDALTSHHFTQPRFLYAETIVGPGATNILQTEIFKASRPTLIDCMWISEESYTVNGWPLPAPIGQGTHASLLPNAVINWWVSNRGRTAVRLRIPTTFDSYMDAERFSITLQAVGLPVALVAGNFLYRFREPWRYPAGSSFHVETQYVTGAAVAPPPVAAAPASALTFHGVGAETRQRRVFEMQFPAVAANASGVAVGTVAQPEFMMNGVEEYYDLTEMQLLTLGGNPADMRLYNMLRWRIVPAHGEPFADEPIPVLAYGIDQMPNGRAILYEPPGGSLLLDAGESINWEIQNTNALYTSRFQIVLASRVAPGG